MIGLLLGSSLGTTCLPKKGGKLTAAYDSTVSTCVSMGVATCNLGIEFNTYLQVCSLSWPNAR